MAYNQADNCLWLIIRLMAVALTVPVAENTSKL